MFDLVREQTFGKQIQGERHLTSNNRIIRISAGSNKRESTVFKCLNVTVLEKFLCDKIAKYKRKSDPKDSKYDIHMTEKFAVLSFITIAYG